MTDFGVYVHVPFCSSRCGYCDFNTYTPGELGSSSSPELYLDALERELDLATYQPDSPVRSIFIGGGTPSLLGAAGLTRILRAISSRWEVSPDAEITTESNPESTSPEFFAQLKDAGFTRISLGMQSASERVLAVLQRRHTPGRALQAAREALAAGFSHVNVDMIYGTPTETEEDVRRTVDAVLSTGVDHVSAYSLIVEEGTAMARHIRQGELPATDEDTMAQRYELIDAALRDAGYSWYEVSNWAQPGGECQHNLIYWRDGNWWGAGPGAHSHIDDQRFFNVKHPARYSQVVKGGELPIAGREILSAEDHHMERVMLGMRLREGIPRSWISAAADPVISGLVHRGLLTEDGQRLRLTEAGRLLADGIVTDLLVAEET